MDLQELVARGRILFPRAPKRIRVFELVNGKRAAREIARVSGRGFAATLADLQKMRDMGLLVYRKDGAQNIVRKTDSVVYDKEPSIKHLPLSYFKDPTKLPQPEKKKKSNRLSISKKVRIPNENEILDICRCGEDQLYEYKSAGTDAPKISREICAFANTRAGGILLYGVDDGGTIGNADMKRAVFDQKIQNSVRNTISPALTIKIVEKDVVGHKIYLVVVPPWNTQQVYQYDGRVLLRHGTNVFFAKPEEVKQLHAGNAVV